MQLPPVKAASFAGSHMEQDEGVGQSNDPPLKPVAPSTKTALRAPKSKALCGKTSTKNDEELDDEYDDEEGACGLASFRKITDVVCLTKVVRAPNALGPGARAFVNSSLQMMYGFCFNPWSSERTMHA